MFEELKQRLQKAIEPLQRYLKVFDQFKEVLKLNPDDYANKIEMDENPWEIEKIQEEIVKVNEMEKKLKFEIPEFVQVSFFQVQMKEILAYLCEKYFQLQKNLTNLIAKRAKQSTITLFNQFQQIKNKIREVPKNIEQLTEIREYMTATPQELEKIKLEMAKCFDIYKILEGFEHRFSKDDMDRKWIIFGAGKEILELIEGRKKELDKDSVKFAEKMADEQTELKDRIDNLDQTIMNFYSFVDLKQHTEIAATAQNVNKCLANFQEDARKFNSREALFGLDSTNYDKINAMVKEFTPYSNLWINADKWIEYQKIWMRDDLEMVDAGTRRAAPSVFLLLLLAAPSVSLLLSLSFCLSPAVSLLLSFSCCPSPSVPLLLSAAPDASLPPAARSDGREVRGGRAANPDGRDPVLQGARARGRAEDHAGGEAADRRVQAEGAAARGAAQEGHDAAALEADL